MSLPPPPPPRYAIAKKGQVDKYSKIFGLFGNLAVRVCQGPSTCTRTFKHGDPGYEVAFETVSSFPPPAWVYIAVRNKYPRPSYPRNGADPTLARGIFFYGRTRNLINSIINELHALKLQNIYIINLTKIYDRTAEYRDCSV